MYCLALFDSGNYAFRLCKILETKGYVFEVISTPCQIAKGGCGYSLKFPIEYLDIIVSEAVSSRMYIREVYKIIPMFSKNKYEKMYI
ncbi:MAG: DUF3343 domain-containing protein [Clostridia bacterium]|nr:DUF3343 domain-containing protein [Clostridia bacterium]